MREGSKRIGSASPTVIKKDEIWTFASELTGQNVYVTPETCFSAGGSEESMERNDVYIIVDVRKCSEYSGYFMPQRSLIHCVVGSQGLRWVGLEDHMEFMKKIA
jgi:hypothetical protein